MRDQFPLASGELASGSLGNEMIWKNIYRRSAVRYPLKNRQRIATPFLDEKQPCPACEMGTLCNFGVASKSGRSRCQRAAAPTAPQSCAWVIDWASAHARDRAAPKHSDGCWLC